jgi:hypothetical protein
VRIPNDASISGSKLTLYLLAHRPRNDKSKFLAQAGFTQQNPEALLAAIRLLAATVDSAEDETDEYGTFYRVEGELIGANGVLLSVTAIWLRRKVDCQFQFITLVPRKE